MLRVRLAPEFLNYLTRRSRSFGGNLQYSRILNPNSKIDQHRRLSLLRRNQREIIENLIEPVRTRYGWTPIKLSALIGKELVPRTTPPATLLTLDYWRD